MRGSYAFNLGAHFDQTFGEIGYFGLARCIFDLRRAMGKARGHQRNMGAADRHLRKINQAAAQAFRRFGNDITSIDLNLGAQFFKRHEQ